MQNIHCIRRIHDFFQHMIECVKDIQVCYILNRKPLQASDDGKILAAKMRHIF